MNTLYAPHIGGGAEITLKLLVETMASRGHQVCVLTTGPTKQLKVDFVDGVRVLRVGFQNVYWHFNRAQMPLWKRMIWHVLDIYNPGMGRVVKKVVADFQPDVVSCHNLAGFSSSTWAVLKAAKVPIVQVLHDYYALCPTSNMYRAGRICAQACLPCRLMRIPHTVLSNRVSAIVGISHFVLNRHLDANKFSKVKLQAVIQNARTGRVTVSPRVEVASPLRFGFIGTLAPAKGIELLLDAYGQLWATEHALYVAGRGEPDYEKSLHSKAGNGVRFLGPMEAAQFFPMIDVLVVPSLWQEPLGMVVVEAFMHGVPVLASRVGGIPEMVKDGWNGLLFDPEVPHELRDKMQHLLNDASQLLKLSAGAMSSASEYVDVAAWAQRYETLLDQVLLSYPCAPSVCD